MKDYTWRLTMHDGAQSEVGTVRAKSLDEATDLALVDAFGSLEHVELPDQREPGRVLWAGQLEGSTTLTVEPATSKESRRRKAVAVARALPKTQIELLSLLLPHSEYFAVPNRLHGAARGLWGHPNGHMVSLIYRDGGELRVRLTGRGRDLAARLELAPATEQQGQAARLSKKEAAEFERSLGLRKHEAK